MKFKSKKIIFLITVIMLLGFSLISPLTNDELWNFGFSYNIANNLVSYRDFNMVTLPFYQLVIGLILKIFGKKMLVINLFCSICYAYVLIKTNKKNYLNCLFLTIYFSLIICGGGALFGYNTFASLILIIVIYLESVDYKYKNEISGFLISMVLMTKINLGLFMFIPYFFFSKNKIKAIIFSSIIPIFIFGYLVVTNSFFDCFDYCFLGLLNFKNNIYVIHEILIVEVIVLIYLLYRYRKTKDKIYVYLIFYQGTLYPLCELHHFVIATIPVLYYIMLSHDKKIHTAIYTAFSISITNIYFNMLFPISLSFFDNKNNFLMYKNIGINYNYINEIKNYLISKKNDNKIFIFSPIADAYLLKMYSEIEISKYDLALRGNMGSNEEKNIQEIDDICHDKKCLFLIDSRKIKNPQFSQKHILYVTSHYQKCDIIGVFDVYCNDLNGDDSLIN